MKLLLLGLASAQADNTFLNLLKGGNLFNNFAKEQPVAGPKIDECGDATSCTECLSPAHDKGGFCGWCSPTNVVYADGTVGKRCADFRDNTTHCAGGKCGWECSGKTETNQCILGWICGGPATNYQCVRSATPGEGTPDYNDCQAGCTPRPSFKCSDPKSGQCSACADPKEPGCTEDYKKCNDGCITAKQYQCNAKTGKCEDCPAGAKPGDCVSGQDCVSSCKAPTIKYKCDIPTNVTKQPQCKTCTDSSSDCRYGVEADCTKNCVWTYKCDLKAKGGPKCSKDLSGHGIPAAPGKDPALWCTQQCKVQTTYTCNETAKTCQASSGSSGQTNKTKCDENCPTKPTPVTPVELRGIWRGLEIHNGFKRGEWTMNVSEKTVIVYEPTMKVYASGNASHRPLTGGGSSGVTGELWIDSKTGTLTGNIKMIYGDANLEPELAYIALGVSETTPNTPVKDYDTAMKTGTDKVLGMLRCKDDANCVWHMPPALPPPPPVETKLATLEAVEATDACNQYLTCNDCIGKAVAGGNTCGWCSQPVVYNTSQPAGPHRCAGHRQSAASGWTCYGVFRTISCSDYVCDPITHQCTEGHGSGSFPTKEGCDQKCKAPPPAPTPCNFAGTYRGIQIDLNYGKGEWDATFSTSGKQTTASFEFVPTGYTYAGDITCSPSKQVTGMGDFQLALTNGTTLYGLYQTGGNQPETEGLSLAFSNDGMTVPPTNFKSAMPGLNASVFGYTKCADYKAGICKF